MQFLLDFSMAPGDVLMLTALVRDLKLTYGDQHQVDVLTNFDAHWHHNPHLTSLCEKVKGKLKQSPSPSVKRIKLTYSPDWFSRERMHFVRWPHKYFRDKIKINVPLLKPHGDLHLTEEERNNPRIKGRYWIVVPGGKSDMPVKVWSQVRFQEVVDRLRQWGLRFVQEGAVKKLCFHPALDNVLNVVGLTSIRDLILNVYHCEGVICGESFPSHLAAVFQKPCVTLAGGRVEPWAFDYSNDWPGVFGDKCEPVRVPHRYLHTLGQLNCCAHKGCWTQRIYPLRDHQPADKNLCRMPMRLEQEQNQPIATCLAHITTDHVIENVMWYYEQGYLAPPQLSQAEALAWRQTHPLGSS